jgi:hypothetical protein
MEYIAVLSARGDSRSLTWLSALIASVYVTRANPAAPPLPPEAKTDINSGREGTGTDSRASEVVCDCRVTSHSSSRSHALATPWAQADTNASAVSIISSMEACAAWGSESYVWSVASKQYLQYEEQLASGSSIQNSAKCLGVLLFSARKVGPKLYTRPMAQAAASACN